jgi:hypothetical protein
LKKAAFAAFFNLRVRLIFETYWMSMALTFVVSNDVCDRGRMPSAVLNTRVRGYDREYF